jgi:hypothetical protein
MVASNPGFVPATSDPLTLRTYEVFFEAIALFLRAEVTLVAEAGFQHSNWWKGLEPLNDIAVLKIIRCQAPDEVARRRAQTRLTAQPTRAAHADTEHFWVSRTFDPVNIEGPTLDVDTSDGWQPNLEEIAAFCRRR